ncbi:hypothetical protein AXK60_21305 [Tsukamurella pseudospumae]|uniref:DUF732 domain-containing protein n=2 Tax=Tsukamurella pseudospumae TaxID=239498 RepID=A0A138AUX5_9ACTN|nr:hypothetical protein AXK61_15220 [Tsukamurella pseudospumae]KXP14223.1 hypothetical protein AXK60_21305 [Tsukamurella pseudospumae]
MTKMTEIGRIARGALIATVAAGGVALAGGGPANAFTAQDQAFLTVLRAQGIVAKDGGATAVRIGKAVCADRRDGVSLQVIVNKLNRQAGLTPYNASYFAGAATRVYCPWYL